MVVLFFPIELGMLWMVVTRVKPMSSQSSEPHLTASQFELDNTEAYQSWRANKMPDIRPVLEDLKVSIKDPYKLSEAERSAVIEKCERYNMAVYQLEDASVQDKSLVHSLGEQFGLCHLDSNLRSDEDSVSSLEVRAQSGNQYIPYTSRALSWHTDGYYNHLDRQIYGIVMHCVRPAAEGGSNSLINPECIYIKLRDSNPAYIEALMHPEAMIIPENIEQGKVIRERQAGPVFMLKANGRLHMRFSARKRNIIWRDTQETTEAVACINELMAGDENILTLESRAGQGIICNNVLHNRSAFDDSGSQKRLLYRARYYDAVSDIA